jgi:hypothetical protein
LIKPSDLRWFEIPTYLHTDMPDNKQGCVNANAILANRSR